MGEFAHAKFVLDKMELYGNELAGQNDFSWDKPAIELEGKLTAAVSEKAKNS